MKKFLQAMLIASAFSSAAYADFSGSYALGLWDIVEQGGDIDVTTNAPASIFLTSANNGASNRNTDFTFTAIEDATITFSWKFTSVDFGGAMWDPFFSLSGAGVTQLSANSGPAVQSGTSSFDVSLGDVFGFRANTIDGIGGSATTEIFNFTVSAPSPGTVPLPPAVWLLGMSISGLLMVQRRAQSNPAANA